MYNDKKIDFNTDNVALVITGCIKPQCNQKWLVLKDEKERLQQYADSIRFFLANSPFRKVIFCENSNYFCTEIESLNKEAILLGKEFEWISFKGDEQKVIKKDKGYGEGEIIEYVIQHSKIFQSVKSFAKVTGRLKISNIEKCVGNVRYEMNYFNRDIYRGHGIDTRFYVCDVEFYKKYLSKAYTQVETEKEVKALEDVFWGKLKHKKYRSLYAYPAFVGVSGGNGRDYSKIPHWKIKLYSVLCQLNMFNLVYPLVLAIRKIKLVINNIGTRSKKYDS